MTEKQSTILFDDIVKNAMLLEEKIFMEADYIPSNEDYKRWEKATIKLVELRQTFIELFEERSKKGVRKE